MNYLDRNGLLCPPTIRLNENDFDCNQGLSYARNWLLDMERKKKCKTSNTPSKCTPSSNMISKEDHEKLMLEQKTKYLKEIERIQREKIVDKPKPIISVVPKKENKPISSSSSSNKIEAVDIKDDAISFLLEVYLSGINQKFEEDKFRELFLQPTSTIKINTYNILNKESVQYIDKIIRNQINLESRMISFEQFIYIIGSNKTPFEIHSPRDLSNLLNFKFSEVVSSKSNSFENKKNYIRTYDIDEIIESLKKIMNPSKGGLLNFLS